MASAGVPVRGAPARGLVLNGGRVSTRERTAPGTFAEQTD